MALLSIGSTRWIRAAVDKGVRIGFFNRKTYLRAPSFRRMRAHCIQRCREDTILLAPLSWSVVVCRWL